MLLSIVTYNKYICQNKEKIHAVSLSVQQSLVYTPPKVYADTESPLRVSDIPTENCEGSRGLFGNGVGLRITESG